MTGATSHEPPDDVSAAEHSGVSSLRDVARTAGVSASTASRVLSGSKHPVSTPTRERVLDAANRLGFEPNRLARALATARSRTIGVVVHDVSDPYFAGIIRGLEDVAGPRDHALFVSSSDQDPEKEVALLRAFVANRVDAIILVASGIANPDYQDQIEKILGRFEGLGGIVVAMSEHPYPASMVTYANKQPTADLTRYLMSLGHRRIAYLSGPTDLVVSTRRFEGYTSAMRAAGLDPERDLTECGWFSMEGGAAATGRILDRARPTAILAGTDLMAIGAERALLDRGYRIPQDISVAGFDDIEFASYAPVPLTTVHVPLTDFGKLGAELALDLLDGETRDDGPTVTPELVVRRSTGPAAP